MPDQRAAPAWRLRALLPVVLCSAALLVMQSPYSVGCLFLTLLAFMAVVVGSLERLLGYIIFILYLGGALILFSYCFMLTPLPRGPEPLPLYLLPLLLLLRARGPLTLTTLSDFY